MTYLRNFRSAVTGFFKKYSHAGKFARISAGGFGVLSAMRPLRAGESLSQSFRRHGRGTIGKKADLASNRGLPIPFSASLEADPPLFAAPLPLTPAGVLNCPSAGRPHIRSQGRNRRVST